MSESSDIETDRILRERYEQLDPSVKEMLSKHGDGLETLKIILDKSIEIRNGYINLEILIPILFPHRRIALVAMMTFIKMNLQQGEDYKVNATSDLMVNMLKNEQKHNTN